MEVRGQPVENSSLLPSCGSWGLNAGQGKPLYLLSHFASLRHFVVKLRHFVTTRATKLCLQPKKWSSQFHVLRSIMPWIPCLWNLELTSSLGSWLIQQVNTETTERWSQYSFRHCKDPRDGPHWGHCISYFGVTVTECQSQWPEGEGRFLFVCCFYFCS